MSSGSPVIRPRAKLSALWRVVAASAVAAFTFCTSGRIDRHAAVAGEVDEALRQIRITGCKRRLDLALRNARVESSVERMIRDTHRIIEIAKRRNRTRHSIDGGNRGRKR